MTTFYASKKTWACLLSSWCRLSRRCKRRRGRGEHPTPKVSPSKRKTTNLDLQGKGIASSPETVKQIPMPKIDEVLRRKKNVSSWLHICCQKRKGISQTHFYTQKYVLSIDAFISFRLHSDLALKNIVGSSTRDPVPEAQQTVPSP